jgi:cellulose synthase/poly-beta-1,6-N-acetylglucosamine synthase-like glycosyltransferase
MQKLSTEWKKKKKRVTVGIPSFNEEVNISNLLQSLVTLGRPMSRPGSKNYSYERKENGSVKTEDKVLNSVLDFIISEIIISDDSSDNTCRTVEAITAENPSPVIKLLHHNTRRGVPAAWNEIFRQATGDIIVLYDADVITDEHTTSHLVDSIKDDIGLCASNPKPLLLKTSMISRASMFITHWLSSVRKSGLSQYTVMGRALSISSQIAKRIVIPENVIAQDLYLQCKVLEQGFNVAYNDDAVVYFKSPNNMLDFSSQILRATNGHKQINRVLRGSCHRLDFRTQVVTTFKSIINDPRGAICVVLCYLLLPYYRTKLTDVNSIKWHIATSTKSQNK